MREIKSAFDALSERCDEPEAILTLMLAVHTQTCFVCHNDAIRRGIWGASWDYGAEERVQCPERFYLKQLTAAKTGQEIGARR